MHQQQVTRSKIGTRYIYEQQAIARYKYYKHDGNHKEVNSGIEITESRGDEDVFPCSLTRSKVHHVGEMRVTTKVPRTPRRSLERHEGSPSSPSPLTKTRALSLWLAFPPLWRWQAPQPLHKLHEGEARASSQSSTKRSLEHQPPSQLGGHPP